MSLSKEALIEGLESVGLRKGQHLVVHSRLSSFGHVEGGADSVIDALEEVVTRKGTLVMPAYSGQVIFLLESLAFRSGAATALSTPFIYQARPERLWSELRDIAQEEGLPYPFASPSALVRRIWDETPRMLVRSGWGVKLSGPCPEESEAVTLTRSGPPLPASEIKPWRMPVWTGAIPDRFWRRPETKRSKQYSGSFAAWGRFADSVLEGHDNRSGQKLQDHPLNRMKELGGGVLLLGVDHRSNSTIHVAEWTAVEESGLALPDSWKEFLGDFQRVDDPLDTAGGQIKGRIGAAEVRMVDTPTLFRVVKAALSDKVRSELGISA